MITQILIVLPDGDFDRAVVKRVLLQAGRDIKKAVSPQCDVQYREMGVSDEVMLNLLRQLPS
jgi:hypothetical protein